MKVIYLALLAYLVCLYLAYRGAKTMDDTK